MYACPSEGVISYHSAYFYHTWMRQQLEADVAGSTPGVAGTIMLGDGTSSWMQSNTLLEGNRFKSRHNEGLNLAFADGHSKWQRLTDIRYGQLNFRATESTTPPASQPMPYP